MASDSQTAQASAALTHPQLVSSSLTKVAIFLVVTINPGEDHRATVLSLCANLSALLRGVGFRNLDGALSCIMGIGSDAWDRLFGLPRPAELHFFQETHSGPRHAVSTPGDLIFHIRAKRMDLCFELAMQIMVRLKGAVSTADEYGQWLPSQLRSAGDRSSLPQKSLVVIQVALSIVLLSGAFLMARSLANLEHQDFGIVTANRYVLRIDPDSAGYTLESLPALYRDIEARLSALPSATNVSFARYTPLDGNAWGTCIVQQGHPAPGPGDNCFSSWVKVSRRFLQTVGVPIVRGRDFSTQDMQSSTPVALVNQSFARRFFPNQDPIGKHFGVESPENSRAFEIAGVFADFKMNDPHREVDPLFLRPLTQQYLGYTDPEAISSEKNSMFVGSIIVQFSRPQNDAENLLRHAMADVDPDLTIFHFASYESQVAGNFNQDRLIARLTSLFGALALILASVGLYGVISFFVARRTTEIGIRMAMGSSRSRVVAMVMGDVFRPVLVGIGLGIPVALYVGRLSASILYGLSSNSPMAYLAATIALAVSAAVAGFAPIRRAVSINPMDALRDE